MFEIRVIQQNNPAPGIKLIEYLINDDLKEITINVDNVEIKNIGEEDYEQFLSEISGININDLVSILDRKCLKVFGKNISDLTTKKRNREEYVFPRQIAMTWAKRNSKASLAFIGSIFDKDHATALHSKKTIEGLLTYDKRIIDLYNDFNNA